MPVDELIEDKDMKSYKLDKLKYELEQESSSEDEEDKEKYRQYLSWVPQDNPKEELKTEKLSKGQKKKNKKKQKEEPILISDVQESFTNDPFRISELKTENHFQVAKHQEKTKENE